MIINLQEFVDRERSSWDELEAHLTRLEEETFKMDLAQARRLHYLYERAAAGLVKISTFSGNPELKRYVESLVARAYAAIYSMDRPRRRLGPLTWFFKTFPNTFQANLNFFLLSLAVTLAGAAFGGAAVAFDRDAKPVLIPLEHLQGNPAERVRQEEQEHSKNHAAGQHGTFAAMLMTHNIQVSILVLALGMTWGLGTIVLLFYNGVILGAVVADYVLAGQTTFLVGWLLPHGCIEIPAILIAGQAGLLLGWTMVGRQSRLTFKHRLRQIVPTITTLILGVAVLLVWAGIVESFFSQYHQPVLPYWLKILFGCVELALLVLLLARRQKGKDQPPGRSAGQEAAAR